MQDICEQYLNLVWWSQMFDTFLMQGGHSRTTGVACVVWGGRSIPGISGSLVWLLSLGAGKAVSVGRTWWHIFSYRFFFHNKRGEGMFVLKSGITVSPRTAFDRSTNGGLLLGSFIGIALGLGLEVLGAWWHWRMDWRHGNDILWYDMYICLYIYIHIHSTCIR